jgi:hypothetical protein
MVFRSANFNAPRAPRGGSGGGRGYNQGRDPGYSTPPVTFDASGRVDQGFGPVGGATAAADDFDIFGVDDPSIFQKTQQQQQSQAILYVPAYS